MEDLEIRSLSYIIVGEFLVDLKKKFSREVSYASLLIQKLHPHSEVTSKTYKPTFLAIHLIAILQPSRYSIFYGEDTPIQLGLSWRSYFYQCLNTETPTQNNRGFTTETLSIFYTIYLYIRLVVIL